MRTLSLLLLWLCCLAGLAENYPYRSDILWVTTPDHADWTYRTGEKATVRVALYRYGILQDNLTLDYELGGDMMPADQKGSVRLKKGEAEIKVGTMTRPGFRDCRLAVSIDGQTYRHHIKLGFSPEQLKPYTQRPADFGEFWSQAREEAAQCPMEVTSTFMPEYSSATMDCYLVRLQCYRPGQYIYGYLTKPKAPGRYPVVFTPPGAGIKPVHPVRAQSFADQGLIRFEIEIHGIRPDLDAATYREISAAFGTQGNSYLVNGLDNRDNYYLKKVYMACIRSLDYLTSLPEWDGRNVIAQGASQGGALALVTTGLDRRVTACVANHPALTDMAGYKDGRAGGYPHLYTKFEGMDTPEKTRTLAYYDVVNFARDIRVPVFLTWGFNDDVCPPTTSYIVYNLLDCPKECLITPVNEHWVSEPTRKAQLEWIGRHLR